MSYLLDASAVIAMARAGKLDVLKRAAAPSAITVQVKEELERRKDETTPAIEAATASWLKTRGRSSSGPRYRRLGLGAGEASVLATAGPQDIVVLDERVARMVARSLGIPHTGLLGLLIDAAIDARISAREAADAVDALSASGFWLSPALVGAAKRRLREAD